MLRPVALALAATLAVTPAFAADMPLKAPPKQTNNCEDQNWAVSNPDDYNNQCGSSLVPLIGGAILIGVIIGSSGGGGGCPGSSTGLAIGRSLTDAPCPCGCPTSP